MIPITRKELYLNKIVGNDDYSVPEKPISEEEFFFAEILGEAVQAPEPLTRYQMYLAKIAGREIEIPYPEVRLEYFLARAAGMNVEAPTPITKEEIYWSNYTAIVDFEVEGVPPLTYKAVAGTLGNYRIYGNTVNGNSVGDRTGNLFDGNFLQGYWADADGLFVVSNKWISTKKIPCKANAQYTFSSSFLSRWAGFFWYDENDNYLSNNTAYNITLLTKTSPSNAAYMAIDIASYPTLENTISPSDVTDFMLVEGSTPLPYEPYGYKVPVTVEGKNLFDVDSYPLISNTAVWANIGNYTSIYGISGTQSYVPCEKLAGKQLTLNKRPGYMYLGVAFYDENKVFISGALNNNIEAGTPMTFTIPLSAKYYRFSVPSGDTEIQIEKGSIATPYEPYHAPVTTPIYLPEQIRKVGDEVEYIDFNQQKQHRVRKNLLQNAGASRTITGVTFTVNDDGSVTCNGQATDNTFFTIGSYYSQSTVIINGCPKNGTSETYSLKIQKENDTTLIAFDTGNGTNSLVITERIAVVIRIASGYTCDNLTFYPMIRKADIADDTYEPYITNTELDVTLPVLPTLPGTNVLSVGTAVQPSKVYVKYKGERQ